jgi:hypothetical protein
MITDGKPSCVRERDGSYYMNSNGLDEYIVYKCYNQRPASKKIAHTNYYFYDCKRSLLTEILWISLPKPIKEKRLYWIKWFKEMIWRLK